MGDTPTKRKEARPKKVKTVTGTRGAKTPSTAPTHTSVGWHLIRRTEAEVWRPTGVTAAGPWPPVVAPRTQVCFPTNTAGVRPWRSMNVERARMHAPRINPSKAVKAPMYTWPAVPTRVPEMYRSESRFSSQRHEYRARGPGMNTPWARMDAGPVPMQSFGVPLGAAANQTYEQGNWPMFGGGNPVDATDTRMNATMAPGVSVVQERQALLNVEDITTGIVDVPKSSGEVSRESVPPSPGRGEDTLEWMLPYGDFVIGLNYQIQRKIGSGSFGDIYQAIEFGSGDDVAVKLEPITVRYPQLSHEYRVLKLLQGGYGIPRLRWFGVEFGYSFLIMDLLGPNLEQCFSFCDCKFSLKTVLMLASQMLPLVEYVHNKNYLHRDLKPCNFLMGTKQESHKVYLIDFGLSKRYRKSDTSEHIQFRTDKNLTGTARFASINSNRGFEISRRDDLESLAYMFLYFLRGALPWQGHSATTKKQKYDKVLEIKLSITVETLCSGLPDEFTIFLNYCRGLEFDEEPNYEHLKCLFRSLFEKSSYQMDFSFDWLVKMDSTP
ncbi:unnamed protein product [Thelazia callipaeda]|uniref:non-specific serine/threonine protein kinase n=1 Tax=Thelazia callipaeda TaxID=103827 RepID=A0A0N5CLM0_THECL|nr:unnamed protein product [Thelazia callipaeda]